MRNRNTSRAGFTLIELMIVVAILAVITAIAYPSYMKSVQKSRRAEGKALVLDAANRQERRFADTTPNAYATNMTNLGYAANPAISENGYYSLASTTTNGFTLTATAINAQADDTAPGRTASVVIPVKIVIVTVPPTLR